MLTSRAVVALALALVSAATSARAEEAIDAQAPPPPPPPQAHRPSLEVNLLWPFFPGGIFEARFVAPVVRVREASFHGAVVAGVYSDFASRVVRTDEHGKVGNLSVKLGWRQYLLRGLHVEVSANLGWRREVMRPNTNIDPIDGFQIRLWILPGYEYAFSPRFYANTRAAIGIHVLRTGPLGDQEKRLAAGADFNFGVRF